MVSTTAASVSLQRTRRFIDNLRQTKRRRSDSRRTARSRPSHVPTKGYGSKREAALSSTQTSFSDWRGLRFRTDGGGGGGGGGVYVASFFETRDEVSQHDRKYWARSQQLLRDRVIEFGPNGDLYVASTRGFRRLLRTAARERGNGACSERPGRAMNAFRPRLFQRIEPAARVRNDGLMCPGERTRPRCRLRRIAELNSLPFVRSSSRRGAGKHVGRCATLAIGATCPSPVIYSGGGILDVVPTPIDGGPGVALRCARSAKYHCGLSFRPLGSQLRLAHADSNTPMKQGTPKSWMSFLEK